MRVKSWEYIINKKYGRLTVISLKKASDGGKMNAVCKCSCGNIKEYPTRNLVRNAYTSCGECYKGIPYKNYTGKKYGYLTVIDVEKNYALCKCSCGNMKKFLINKLEDGIHKSCGNCLHGISPENFLGKKFGCLTVIAAEKYRRSRGLICTCKCNICGAIKTYNYSDLKKRKHNRCWHQRDDYYKAVKSENCIGKTFGYLTIINRQVEKNIIYAVCACKCGNKTKINFSHLVRKNPTLSCGCLKKIINSLKKISFGNLNIIRTSNHNLDGLRYVCKCSCGNEVEVLESDLFTGKVTSCEECSKS